MAGEGSVELSDWAIGDWAIGKNRARVFIAPGFSPALRLLFWLRSSAPLNLKS
jgi:hypothetical protein